MAESVRSSTPAGKKQDETMGMDKTTPVSPVSASGRLSATKMSPAKDSYWFAHAAEPKEMIRSVTNTSFEKDDSSFTQDHTSPSHKSVDKNTDLHMETTSPVEKLQVPPRAATPNRLDSYWFAHGGGNDLSSPSGDQASDSGFSDGKETSPLVFQREKKDEAHKRREQNEKDVNSQEILRSQQKSKLQINNMDRIQNIESFISQKKQIVEERKGYIWDTEREQRDGILKQNYEQEAKLEARRNAQRNSLSFAFGNSALDNSIATSDGHSTYHGSEILFPIIRHVDDKDVLSSKTQDMSSYNLIQKIVDTSISPVTTSEIPHYENRQRKRNCLSFASNQTKACLTWSDYVPFLTTTKENDNDCMSRSMIINSTNVRGRRKTDLVPVVPWSRATVPRTTSPGNQGKRSVSMSRLDQLAQPRRHYVEARQEMGKNASSNGSHSFSPSMNKSMYNVNSHRLANKKLYCANMSSMSKSMLHLANPYPTASNISCASVNVQSCMPMHSSLANSKRLSQSMMHLSVAPRPTRASRLRAEALAAAREKGFSSSMLLLNKNDAFGSKLSLAPATRKEVSHSPARPRSSLSTAVESSGQMQQPKVTMRQKTKSKPRPTSIAGTVPDYTLKTSVLLTKEQQRPSRPSEKKGSGLTAKPSVAKVTTKPPVAQKPITTAVIVEKKDSDNKSDRSISPQPMAIISQPKGAAPQSVAEITAKSPPPPHSLEGNEESISSNKPRIISEEEAKAALQEKRRLAREQAEREAELERQRQEEMRRLEEEKKRKEEEEQRRQEEEQLRLMEELKRQEEEKLKKAIEERERREEEEQRKKEEEEKLKAEREEQERKAREEAERQHKELEERLKREEAERAERKRRVEQIMSRTRGKSGQQSEQDKPISNNILTETTLKLAASGQLPSSVLLAISSIQDKQKDDVPNNNVSTEKLSDDIKEEKVEGEQTVVDSKDMKINDKNSTSGVETTLPVGNINKMTTDSKQSSFITIDNIKGSEKTDSCDKSEIKTNTSDIQTNGYNSNEEKEIESIRSFERLESSSNKDLRKVSQSSSGEEIIDSSLDQVINLEETTNTEAINQNDVNLLNNADDINSNRVPGNPLIAFEDIRQKETSVTG